MRVRWAGAIALSIATFGMSAAGARAADPGEQIAALQDLKRSLSPAERKLDSRLAVDLRTKQAARTVEVDISVRAPGADLVPRLLKLRANVRYVSPRSGAIRAAVPSTAIRTVAAWGEVERVDPAADAKTMRMGGTPRTKEERGTAADNARRAAAAIVSEGVAAHGVNTVFERDKVTGTGVKVCVLSDGVDSLSASQAAGELPPTSTCSRPRRARATRARRCSRSSTTWRPARSSASPPRSSATPPSPTTSARCASTPAAT